MNLPGSSGVFCQTSRPMAARVLRSFGSVRACWMGALSFATISGGVFGGANTAHHEVASTAGRPDSAMVGISGATDVRCRDVTATAFNLPP